MKTAVPRRTHIPLTPRKAPVTRKTVAVALAAVVLIAACGDDAGDDEAEDTTVTIAEGPVAPTALVPGDCVTGLALGLRERVQVTAVDVVDCSGRHDLEVFATFELTAEAIGAEALTEFPGRARVIRAAEVGCNGELAETGADISSLGAIAIWPTAASWRDGDRSVLCAIYQQGGSPFDGRHFDFGQATLLEDPET